MTGDGVDVVVVVVVWTATVVVVWTATEFGGVCAAAELMPANANESGSAASERLEYDVLRVRDVWRVQDICFSGDMDLAVRRHCQGHVGRRDWASARQLCQWPATQT